MRYRLGMKDDGWLVVDTERRRVAHFGGLKLDGLTPEEAHVMLGLVEACDRGAADEADSPVTPFIAAPAARAEARA
jgi:hypothetical protein